MGRTLGSKNRPKTPSNKNGVYITNFEKMIEGAAITKDSSMGWIRFGAKNNWPNLMLDLYA